MDSHMSNDFVPPPPGRFMPPPPTGVFTPTPPPEVNSLVPPPPREVGGEDIGRLAGDGTRRKDRSFQSKSGRGIPDDHASVGVEFVVSNAENMRLDKIAAVLGVPKRKMLGDILRAYLDANVAYYDSVEAAYVDNGGILPSVRNKGIMTRKPNLVTGRAGVVVDMSLSPEQRRQAINTNMATAKSKAAEILARRRTVR